MAGNNKSEDRPAIAPMVLVLKPKLAASLDNWIASQPKEVDRLKAIRKLLKYAIKKKMKVKAKVQLEQ